MPTRSQGQSKKQQEQKAHESLAAPALHKKLKNTSPTKKGSMHETLKGTNPKPTHKSRVCPPKINENPAGIFRFEVLRSGDLTLRDLIGLRCKASVGRRQEFITLHAQVPLPLDRHVDLHVDRRAWSNCCGLPGYG